MRDKSEATNLCASEFQSQDRTATFMTATDMINFQ